MGSRFLFWGDESVLQLDRDDHCTTLQIYYKPLKWYFLQMVTFMVCELCLNKYLKAGQECGLRWKAVSPRQLSKGEGRKEGREGRQGDKYTDPPFLPPSGWLWLPIGQTQLEVSEWANIGVVHSGQPPRQTAGWERMQGGSGGQMGVLWNTRVRGK